MAAPEQNSSEQSAVRAAETALYAAMVARDLKALDGILADDVIYLHSTAVAEPKAEYIRRVGEGFYDYSKVESQDVTVRVDGDLAVIYGIVMMDVATAGGPLLTMRLYFTLVWVRRNGKWQLALRQSTNANKA